MVCFWAIAATVFSAFFAGLLNNHSVETFYVIADERDIAMAKTKYFTKMNILWWSIFGNRDISFEINFKLVSLNKLSVLKPVLLADEENKI